MDTANVLQAVAAVLLAAASLVWAFRRKPDGKLRQRAQASVAGSLVLRDSAQYAERSDSRIMIENLRCHHEFVWPVASNEVA